VVELTCYYYSMFIPAAFLSDLRGGVEQCEVPLRSGALNLLDLPPGVGPLSIANTLG
jgi:hypothetical protein